MLLENQTILERNGLSLMTLEKHSCNSARLSTDSARLELLEKASRNASMVWGYFPAFEGPEEYPESVRLASEVRNAVLDDGWGLSFARVSSGRQESVVGGLHVDANVDGTPTRDPHRKPGKEILRALVNVGPSQRVVSYCEQPLEELERLGVQAEDTGYARINPAKRLELKAVAIPPPEDGAVWVLKFWASLVPHAGEDGENGHFLLVYGKYASIEDGKKPNA